MPKSTSTIILIFQPCLAFKCCALAFFCILNFKSLFKKTNLCIIKCLIVYSNFLLKRYKVNTFTSLLCSPEKVKLKPSRKKNKKINKERDLYKNHSHACESLLSLMVDKKRRWKTAIPSLKKSGPELPELLTQISAGIAGTGLAVLLSVICKLACGRVLLSASSLFNAGLGFGLVWLSWAVSKLKATIVFISKNAGKMNLKEEEMIQKLDKSIRDIYFGSAAVLAVAVLSLG